jgi:DNA-binding GntR family transcriptional regulator
VLEEAGTYEKLKLMILDGSIARGEPLVERSLAERLGVSRTPVRETILRLAKEGLVRIVERRGAFVADYTIEDVIEIYQVREGLEPVAARLSCAHIREADLDRFQEQFRRYKSARSPRDDDPHAWRKLGRDFHDLFIRASQNGRIIHALDGLRSQTELVRGLSRPTSDRAVARSSIDEHLEILRALKARTPQRAERAVRTHLQNGLRDKLKGLHQNHLVR